MFFKKFPLLITLLFIAFLINISAIRKILPYPPAPLSISTDQQEDPVLKLALHRTTIFSEERYITGTTIMRTNFLGDAHQNEETILHPIMEFSRLHQTMFQPDNTWKPQSILTRANLHFLSGGAFEAHHVDSSSCVGPKPGNARPVVFEITK